MDQVIIMHIYIDNIIIVCLVSKKNSTCGRYDAPGYLLREDLSRRSKTPELLPHPYIGVL